ncbi:hypothetical protein AWC05_10880 [Mycobacterium florentinum]|uniref:Uncharacterized protein n=1 Tax=Mycobacterium florentinum TaxID=292462 RepID=A0A1X1UFW4_MYCFL|nr:hypothetical protein AWC05_10880 [Mycobacterium florentinum]
MQVVRTALCTPLADTFGVAGATLDEAWVGAAGVGTTWLGLMPPSPTMKATAPAAPKVVIVILV